jgi:hypothetical protein
MVRPTRSLVVTGIPISAAPPEIQSAEKEITAGLFFEQREFCTLQGSPSLTNAWAIPKVAKTWRPASQILRAADACFIGIAVHNPRCNRIGRFLRDFCGAASRQRALL